MLKVHGNVYIPVGSEVKVQQYGKGAYFNMKVIAPDTDMKGNSVRHVHDASMFVPDDEISKWKDVLKPGTSIEIESGWWESKEKEEGIPWAKLKLSRTAIRVLRNKDIQ